MGGAYSDRMLIMRSRATLSPLCPLSNVRCLDDSCRKIAGILLNLLGPLHSELAPLLVNTQKIGGTSLTSLRRQEVSHIIVISSQSHSNAPKIMKRIETKRNKDTAAICLEMSKSNLNGGVEKCIHIECFRVYSLYLLAMTWWILNTDPRQSGGTCRNRYSCR